VCSALIVEAFPPSSLNEAIFQARNLTTGETVTDGNLAMAGQLLIALIIVPILIALSITTLTRARLLINLWMAGAAVSCVVALLTQFAGLDLESTLTGHSYAFQSFHGAAGRLSGLAVHPVQLGITAAMPVPVALRRMVTGRGTGRYGLLVALYSLAALVSGSRSAVIGLLAAFIFIFAWEARARARLIAVAVVAGLVGYISGGFDSVIALQRLFGDNASAAASSAASDTGRLSSYNEALNAFLARPLTGYGFQGLRGAHNVILEMLSSGGVLLLAGYTIVIGGALYLAWIVRPQLPPDLRGDALGLVGAIGVVLTVSMVENTSLDRYLYVPIALILGLFFVSQRVGLRTMPHKPAGDRGLTATYDAA